MRNAERSSANMKRMFTWFFIFLKRSIKRASLIFTLSFLLVMTVALRLMSTDITAGVKVGFYINKNTDNYDKMVEIINSLLNHDGIIEFVSYDSREHLESDVTSSSIQGGYIFSDDFYDRFTECNNRKVVELIEAPENSVSSLSNVVLLATVMENIAGDVLVEDASSQDFFVDVSEKDYELLLVEYKKYASNGTTFSFDYSTLYEDYKGSSKSINISSFLVTPVRGIVAIFIFIIALTGGVSWFNDKNSFIYANIPLNKRYALKLLVISTPVIIAMTAGYLSLVIAGICDNPIYELYVVVVYSVICISFTYILTTITTESLFCALIPVFILGSIICCPIFFNLANLIPAMKILQKLFIPTYYFMI